MWVDVLYCNNKKKLKVPLTGCVVVMAICYVKRMTTTCLPMIRHLSDTIIVAPVVVLILQSITVGKSAEKLFPASLRCLLQSR